MLWQREILNFSCEKHCSMQGNSKFLQCGVSCACREIPRFTNERCRLYAGKSYDSSIEKSCCDAGNSCDSSIEKNRYVAEKSRYFPRRGAVRRQGNPGYLGENQENTGTIYKEIRGAGGEIHDTKQKSTSFQLQEPIIEASRERKHLHTTRKTDMDVLLRLIDLHNHPFAQHRRLMNNLRTRCNAADIHVRLGLFRRNADARSAGYRRKEIHTVLQKA